MALMDRQDAIDLLDNLIGMVDDNHGSDYDAALRMGIEALKAAEPNLQQSCNQLATDTISRQAAIDALNEYFARIGRLKRRGLTKGEKAISLDTVGAIKTLPSAEPEPSDVARDIATIIENEKDMRVIEEVSAPEPHWIPVTERWPEIGVDVLVTEDTGGMKEVWIDSCWVDDDTGRTLWYVSLNVTAWMPLPRPWEGEANED